MKGLLLLTVFSLFSFNTNGQANVSNGGGVIMHVTLDDDVTKSYKRGAYTGKPHQLGDSITALLDGVERTYVYYVEQQGAYATEEKKIEKKAIYFASKKILKIYNKKLRKEEISEEKAREELFVILNNAIKVKNYKTEGLELLLEDTKSDEMLVNRFLNMKFLNTDN